MKVLDEMNTRELSKKIYRTNIMPTGSSSSFLKISRLLIAHLQSGANSNKIERILESELVTTYGLTIKPTKVGEISKDIVHWYDG